MKKNSVFLFFLLVFGCTKTLEERSVENFLSLWGDVRSFYTNKVGEIASTGFLNPILITMLHRELMTNESFFHVVTQRFPSVEEYVSVFSNVTLHYVYLSFTEDLAGRSPDVLLRELDDALQKIETISERPTREQKRETLLLLRKRLEEYKALHPTISSNWVRVVYRYAQELGKLYQNLIQ